MALGFLKMLVVVMTRVSVAEASSVGVSVIKSLKDATHIELTGLADWRYDISRKNIDGLNHIFIQFQGVKPESLARLLTLTDRRIKKIVITEGMNTDALVDIEVNDGAISLFDYQTESPVNLILDLYKDEVKIKPKVMANKNHLNKKQTKRVPKTTENSAVKLAEYQPLSDEVAALIKKDKKSREPASLDALEIPSIPQQPLLSGQRSDSPMGQSGIFDGADRDLKRFKAEEIDKVTSEIALVKSQQDLYLHFPELIVEHSYIDQVFGPGGRKFEVPTSDSEDNQQVRLIIKLYAENKLAVAMRAMKFFKEKFPNSTYEKTLDAMKAEIYFKLWQRDHNRTDLQQAIALYKEELNRDREDPERYRNIMLIGLSYIALGNHFGALSSFQVGVQNYPNSPYYWPMRLAVAEAYRKLNKFDDALKELSQIEDDPQALSYRAEASFKRGDIYFHKMDYSKAISEYRESFKKYPLNWANAPNIFFNLAESLFWQKEYKASLDAYRDFLQRFPSNEFGGFAMTRLGEILEILGESSKKVNGAYLESYFRFHESAGAYLAKVRINSSRFVGFKPKELASVLKEQESEKPTNIDEIDAFIILQNSDGFLKRKDFVKSRELLSKYYQQNPLSPHLEIFKNRITKNITAEIQNYNNSQAYVDALKVYIHNSDTWLLKNTRIDTDFETARAYEALNLPDDASKFYKKCLEKVSKLSPEEFRQRSIIEKLPTADEIRLRLAKTSEDAEDFNKASEYLASIKQANLLTEESQVEKSLLTAKVAEKEERFDVATGALKDLTEHWKGNVELLNEPWLRLAEIYNNAGNLTAANIYTDKIISHLAGSEDTLNPASRQIARRALELAAEIDLKKSKGLEAIKNLSLILEKYSDDSSAGRIRYKLGKIYFDQKNIREAAKTWSPLNNQAGQELWAKMASERLASAQWSIKYDRYLQDTKNDRQPAGVKK